MIKKNLVLLFFSVALFSNAQNVRHIETINDAWHFYKGNIENPFSDDASRSWEKVTLPHSWNTQDILDDKDGYYRGEGWYTKTMKIPQIYENQQVFLLFEAANQVTSLFVNGKSVGDDHIGGYTTFARDITNTIQEGENEITIKVDNAHNDEIVPQSADFSFYGGIYRDIHLVITKPVHFEVANLGANAVFITTPDVSEKEAKVSVKSKLVRPKKGTYYVKQSLFDTKNNLVKSIKTKSKFDKEVVSNFSIENPNLWSTCRHQDFYGKANAVSDEVHRNDMKLLKEMGSNFLRIAHYPQDPAILEMCNKMGFIATVEIPFVDKAAANEAGKQNSVNMLKEAIRFNYNNPSIVAWNLGNETTMKAPDKLGEEYTKHFIETHKVLSETIKKEDKTRYSYTVFFREPAYQDKLGIRNTELVGYNKYYAWYRDELEDVDKNLRSLVERTLAFDPDKPLILSEYGGGADPRLRTYNPTRFDFSVEYQFLLHKAYMKAILEIPEIVGANVWNFADFQVEHRKDAVPHINSKGIVSADRKKKDAYYLYQALLKKTPFLAIASKGWTKRAGIEDVENADVATQPITVVGNGDEVELFINGKTLGKQKFDFATATFNVPFQQGQNLIEVVSEKEGKVLKDFATIEFTLQPKNLKSETNPFQEIAINVGSYCYFVETHNVDYVWMPDQPYEKGSFGYVGGELLRTKTRRRNNIGVDISVKGTENDPIYQTQMIGLEAYKFDVPKGTYELSLSMAELKSRGENVMDIVVNDKKVWENLNLKKQYGKGRGITKRFLISVDDENGITVNFKALKGKTRLSGIKLRRVY